MPKRAQEQHENDDGFVEDAPQSKKAKNAGANPSKKSAISPLIQVDDEGNDYWELSDTRRVGVSTYKGMTLINIREYYEKDGKSLPGRKGISLSVDQYTALLSVLPQLETLLHDRGIEVPRPRYDSPAGTDMLPEEEAEEVGEVAEEEQDVKPSKRKLDKKLKANHETTSDEDEDEG
ncbi:hypothetical protein LTR91_020064 [Friedmanniomyces endolithicus]|uniref:Transcriptional coactivator p15 (PC4) C-terminal domain-containing protein n=2 Tax=Dothideomycetidae TaxID=451867 RepID=A0AAN6H9M7_9PEZI|nr:hypothetical protein LTR94_011482 [Friedmanniomyces endolithicus]KAK5147458.1 hypothetical protein LTR32_001115 [Rachicladosporium monterosium]KAK0793288.1 hypothetical protein LTR59_008200 [Friedmanniomyces endolithicus]KAK0795676.1 hypothetical protein LTR38_008779 [Friedmanniomyces endolithicus]KAK0806721.1 hypothetical protein LTR75_006852 [Friedmanniomyces endolithicus]